MHFNGCCVLSGRLGTQPQLGLDRRESLMRLAQMVVVQHQKNFIVGTRYADAGSASIHERKQLPSDDTFLCGRMLLQNFGSLGVTAVTIACRTTHAVGMPG